MKNLLEINGLHVEISSSNRSNVKPLKGVDLIVEKEDTVGLVGESGCGKSMILRTILKMLPHGGSETEGEIIFNGNRIDKDHYKNFENIRGKKISMIFQDPISALSPLIKVGDQISDIYRYNEKTTKEEARDIA